MLQSLKGTFFRGLVLFVLIILACILACLATNCTDKEGHIFINWLQYGALHQMKRKSFVLRWCCVDTM